MRYIDFELLKKNTDNLGLIGISDEDIRHLYVKYEVNTHNQFLLFSSWAKGVVNKIPIQYQGYDRLEKLLSIYSGDKKNIAQKQEATLFVHFLHDLYAIIQPRFTPKRKEGFKEEFIDLLKKHHMENYAEIIDWDAM